MMGLRIKTLLMRVIGKRQAMTQDALPMPAWRQGAGVLRVCLMMGVPWVAASLFHVWVQLDTLRLGYALTAAEEHAASLSNQLRQLDVELAAEHAPARLAAMAQRANLHAPSPGQIWPHTPVRDTSRADAPAVAGHRKDRPTFAEAAGAEHAQP